MNPHTEHPCSPVALIQSLLVNWGLIGQLVKREVVGRYKGSFMGLGWSFFNPILMLAIYTFVFSVVFKARWGIGIGESKTEFAIILFAGLIVHALFAEVLNRAPALMLSNVNYVKKVVFPLEILPIVAMGFAIFHTVVSLGVLLGVFIFLNGFLHWTVLLIPLVLLPLIFVTLGVAWLLASLGVYLRDVGQTIGIITTIMLFLAPVFYPLSAIPDKYQIYILINPLTFIIEQTRRVLLYGQLPDWQGLSIYWAISFMVGWIGYWWFQKTRKGFADVL
jgi:lipopolysaccharide transport system permease protein